MSDIQSNIGGNNQTPIQGPISIPQQEQISGIITNLIIKLDTLENSQAVTERSSPETAIPFLQQPEVQQAVVTALMTGNVLPLLLLLQAENLNTGGNSQGGVNGIGASITSLADGEGAMASFLFSLEETVHTVIIDMWTKYNEEIRKQREADEEYAASPEKAAKDEETSNAHLAKEEAKKAHEGKGHGEAFIKHYAEKLPPQFREALLRGDMQSVLDQSLIIGGSAFFEASKNDPSAALNLQILTGTILLATAMGIETPHGESVTLISKATASLIQDMVSKVSQSVTPPLLPSSIAAELGLIAALFSSTLLIRAAGIEYISNLAQGKGKDVSDVNFAKGYAMSVLSLVNSLGFDADIMAILTQKHGDSAPAQKSDDKK